MKNIFNFLISFFMVLVVYLNISTASKRHTANENIARKSYRGYRIIRSWPNPQSRDFDSLNDILQSTEGALILNPTRRLKQMDIFVEPSKFVRTIQILKERYIDYKILVHDLERSIKMESKPTPPWLLDKGTSLFRSGTSKNFNLGKYHSYNEIFSYLNSISEENPDLIKIEDIGKSYEGRKIPFVKIGYKPQYGKNKIGAFIESGIHAREWIAPAVTLCLIDELVNNRNHSSLLQQIDVYIVPMLNPDGYEFSKEKDRMWRRTRSRGQNPDDCLGADANRNFPYHWNETGSSGEPCSEIYSGSMPLSELECKELTEFLKKTQSQLRAYLSLHSYGNLILYPWGYKRKLYTTDHQVLEDMGNKMAHAILAAGGPRYQVGTGADILYEASGASDDYAKSLGIKYSYTIEMTSGDSGGFILPEGKISETCKHVVPGILVLLEEMIKEKP